LGMEIRRCAQARTPTNAFVWTFTSISCLLVSLQHSTRAGGEGVDFFWSGLWQMPPEHSCSATALLGGSAASTSSSPLLEKRCLPQKRWSTRSKSCAKRDPLHRTIPCESRSKPWGKCENWKVSQTPCWQSSAARVSTGQSMLFSTANCLISSRVAPCKLTWIVWKLMKVDVVAALLVEPLHLWCHFDPRRELARPEFDKGTLGVCHQWRWRHY